MHKSFHSLLSSFSSQKDVTKMQQCRIRRFETRRQYCRCTITVAIVEETARRHTPGLSASSKSCCMLQKMDGGYVHVVSHLIIHFQPSVKDDSRTLEDTLIVGALQDLDLFRWKVCNSYGTKHGVSRSVWWVGGLVCRMYEK